VLEIAFRPDPRSRRRGRSGAGRRLRAAPASRRDRSSRRSPPLPPDVDGDAVHAAARAAGVAYDRGDVFFLTPPRRPSLMLSFASAAPDRIAEGVDRLGAIGRAARRARSTGRVR